MADTISDKVSEGKLDLVPMIDCVMLLLLFFIITTKFTAEEKAIASLLPAHGQAQQPQAPMVPRSIDISIYPEGLAQGQQPRDYRDEVLALKRRGGEILANAQVRIGGEDALEIPGVPLSALTSPAQEAIIASIRTYVSKALAQRERSDAGSRPDQDPVVIHCYSGLSWKFAIVVYDAVRAFELETGASALSTNARAVVPVREVTFAPRALPNLDGTGDGEELYEIVNGH